MPRRLIGDPLLAGALGGTAIALIELVSMGAGSPGLVAAVVALFAATGALAGAVMLGTEALAGRLGWTGWRAALLCALPSLAIWVPVCATLFEGAFAATLPGASVAPYLLPPLLVVAVAIAAAIAAWWQSRPRPAGSAVLGGALLLLLAVLWFANHRMFRSGYADLHAGLTLCEIVLAALVLRVGGEPGLAMRARVGVAAVVVTAMVVALLFGLGDADDRRAITTRGDDTRHLVRLWRSILDLDRDGTSAVLGGGDCDDRDAARHPGARDIPGNGRDEDCDGADAIPHVPSPKAIEQAKSLADWRAEPAVTETLARTRDLNVLVVSVDALRWDLLAPDAPDRDDFPHLVKLLEQSVWFQRSIAPAAGTDVSLSGFITGRWNPFQPVDQTLLEAMQASGRFTGAIFPREVLRYAPEPLLSRGVDQLERVITDGTKRDVGDRVTAGTTTDLMLKLLDAAGDRRFFIWAHYFDAHEHKQIDVPAELMSAVAPGPTERSHKYRALLKGIDDELGRLLGEVERRGLADRTIVVLFSDHGESLGEDPRLPDNHGVVVYNAMTRVPVAFRVPGIAARAELEPLSLVDLAPTLLALIGAPPLPIFDGADLLPSLLGAPPELAHHDRALVSNESEQWAVIEWPWKLLVRPADNLHELYDLDADPSERTDVSAAHPDRVRELRSRYGDFPTVPLDRTRAGRKWREAQARPPTARAP